MFDFLDFKIIDFIDILLVTVLLYHVYKLVRGTVAIHIFIGIVMVYFIWKLTEALQMELLSNIFGKFIGVGVFALIVVFQQEIRKFLLMIGSTNFTTKRNFVKHFKFLQQEKQQVKTDISAILHACTAMSISKTGAIIVLEKNTNLDFIKNSGDPMHAKVNKPILESIFYKNSPLHDGAIVIQKNYITATRVILPVSNQRDIPLHFGLRHRAGFGITEKTDALVLVVSEETGKIAYIKNGAFVLYKNLENLETLLKKELNLQ